MMIKRFIQIAGSFLVFVAILAAGPLLTGISVPTKWWQAAFLLFWLFLSWGTGFLFAVWFGKTYIKKKV